MDARREKTRALVFAAMFAALVCVATMVLTIPLPGNGFANLGDGVILVAAWTLGPVWGAAASGIGAGLADLLLGYGVYAPATLVIKALMAVVAVCAGKSILRRMPNRKWLCVAISAVLAECVMILGYFLFECILYGGAVALADIVGNAGQAAVGIVVGTLLTIMLQRLRKGNM